LLELAPKRRRRRGGLCLSEVMPIVVGFHLSGQRTPCEAGGLQGMAVSKTAFSHLEPTVLVKLLLLTDIFLDGFQLKTHRRYGIAARPEMLAGKVPYLPTKLTGYRQGTLSLQKPYH
jgi:hypothetical protein